MPKCWLSGFTGAGDDEGFLYVTDLKRRKQWRCKPSEAGHRRDFNRIEHPNQKDPLAVEKSLAAVESSVAPLLRALVTERRGVRNDIELGTLVEFMSIQAIRVPQFREFIKRATMKFFRDKLLKDRQTWENTLLAASLPLNSPGAEYSRVVRSVDEGHITVADDPAFHLFRGAQQLEAINEGLRRRKWGQLISQKGLFIGSENPVMLDGEEHQRLGFSNAPLVVFPVNRFLVLYGTNEDVRSLTVTTKLIAGTNTFAMMVADGQVFSHRPDFYWLDSTGRCQNDWRIYDRENYPGLKLAP